MAQSSDPTHATMDQIKRLVPSPIKRFVRRLLPRGLDDAKHYVRTDEESGRLQFELLKRQGCRPDYKVLEIGCGCLHAGIPLIQYLEKGNYVGVDPNIWLRQEAMKNRRVRQLVKEQEARFLSVDDFDASELGIKFDLVFAHSVLSHCAHWQLEQFLRNVGKVLAPGGRILASIRLAEGNAYGSGGASDREDSMDEEWQYPGVSWFKLSTITKMATIQGLSAVHIPEYTEFYTNTRPDEYHDWLVFSWKP
jgi:cyclopropane fatty-acyl-phospholipid synthase-like methyltransferase